MANESPTADAWIHGQGKVTVCCKPMAEAFCSGTDGEGYSSLFSTTRGFVTAGCHPTELSFCPWCRQTIDWAWLKGRTT